MKVDAPDDLDGRQVLCQYRAKMIGDVLQVLARQDLIHVDDNTLYALGQVAHELADELEAIREKGVAHAPAE